MLKGDEFAGIQGHRTVFGKKSIAMFSKAKAKNISAYLSKASLSFKQYTHGSSGAFSKSNTVKSNTRGGQYNQNLISIFK